MCDPLVGLVTGIASMGASMAAGSAQASQLQAVQDAQLAANAQWVNYQNQIHQEQVTNENTYRQQADTARQQTLQKVAPANQQQQQQAEAARLTDAYTNPGGQPQAHDPNNVASMALSGQDVSGNKGAGLAAAVSQASNVARQRIAALATANSYGGSFGGLGTIVPQEFQQGGNQIQLNNDIRNANLKTYGVEQQVQPIQYAVGSGTEALGGIAKALGGMGGTLISKGISGVMSGGAAPAAGPAPSWSF